VCLCDQLVALMAVRKAMDFMFTQRDLYWLDHLLPDESRRKKEDTKMLETLEQQRLEQVKPKNYFYKTTQFLS